MKGKRMIARTIIEADDFFDLPHSAQVLYFHLLINTDDDGFIGNPRTIIRTTGTTNEDMEILINNGYVYKFDSGVVVILHFHVHNTLDSKHRTDTDYTKEKALLVKGEDKVYRLKVDSNESQTIPQYNKTESNIIESNKINPSEANPSEANESERNGIDRDIATQGFIRLYPQEITPQEQVEVTTAIMNVPYADLAPMIDGLKVWSKWAEEKGIEHIDKPVNWIVNRKWEKYVPKSA